MLELKLNTDLYLALEEKANAANQTVYMYIRNLIKQDIL